ncbi:MAG: hypothetical protein ACRELX_17565, partial [Longimicrobiales bacterium]
MKHAVAVAFAVAVAIGACDSGTPDTASEASADSTALLASGVTPDGLAERVSQFAPADIDFDASVLEPWERQVIGKLVEASDVVHDIFAHQATPDYDTWAQRVEAYDGRGAAAVKTYFDIMIGPWDRLEHNEPFLAAGPKPAGAAYYPADLTSEELDAWIAAHPDDRDA